MRFSRCSRAGIGGRYDPVRLGLARPRNLRSLSVPDYEHVELLGHSLCLDRFRQERPACASGGNHCPTARIAENLRPHLTEI